MKLSVLVCTITSRVQKYLPTIINNLHQQSDGEDVEILYLGDNKKRSVGHKRNDLLALAQGQYVAFVDDDDEISNDYAKQICNAASPGSDIIVFDVEISENGGPRRPVVYDKDFQADRNFADRFERIPNHLMPVKRELAIQAGYPDKSFAEDAEYAKRLKPLLQTQTRIYKTLYYYKFFDAVSETR